MPRQRRCKYSPKNRFSKSTQFVCAIEKKLFSNKGSHTHTDVCATGQCKQKQDKCVLFALFLFAISKNNEKNDCTCEKCVRGACVSVRLYCPFTHTLRLITKTKCIFPIQNQMQLKMCVSIPKVFGKFCAYGKCAVCFLYIHMHRWKFSKSRNFWSMKYAKNVSLETIGLMCERNDKIYFDWIQNGEHLYRWKSFSVNAFLILTNTNDFQRAMHFFHPSVNAICRCENNNK